MTAFVNKTVSDIRGGRDSWRVVILFSSLSFAISIATTLARHAL
jgi:hypothetical protein